ncbi:hypothetical protein [Shewanella zhangzhouensis]|uniref:hypothetical protein n=1 Tax=Shewanella zhangzhouensis TaxID=2864213 RepID=UPI001C65FE5A|nr:hypothetical protein [Shewanella zhangzhouensis]QYK06999.1 hypothetical protein K0H63_09490 [Shewanella zhangzhouensis]
MSVERVNKILEHWGATLSQIELILPRAIESEIQQREQYIIAINECLQLLYRESSEQKNFMNHVSKSLFFKGRKPLAVITSGTLDDLAQAHQSIRSMVCI